MNKPKQNKHSPPKKKQRKREGHVKMETQGDSPVTKRQIEVTGKVLDIPRGVQHLLR